MMLGEYSDWSGWEYRDPWAATLWHHKEIFAPVMPWNGVHTPCLYVIGEQGVGDEVLFASCLPDAIQRTDRLILECQPKMRSVFERSFGIETVAAKTVPGNKRVRQDLPEGVTAWMSLGDLPRMWRLALHHFPGTPYLQARRDQVERFAAYRGRTGISWRGRQGEEKALIALHPEAVSLQYDTEWDEDVERPDLDLRDDIEGILGLTANLAKVVTVSTSVAHFAAAMGVETHVIIADPASSQQNAGNMFPFKWLCGETGRTPWYGTARTYRNLNDYRARCLPKGTRMGRADRREHSHPTQESVVAGA